MRPESRFCFARHLLFKMTDNTGNGISGKMKTKRLHGPSKPYERKKSLFGSLTDTMKVVVTPSWLSDIVRNVTRSTRSETEKVTNGDDVNHLLTDVPNQKSTSPAIGQFPDNAAQSILSTPSCALTPQVSASGNVSFQGVALGEKNETTNGYHPDLPFHMEKPLNIQDSTGVTENGVTDEESEDSVGLPSVRLNPSIPTTTWTAEYNSRKLKKPAVHSNPSFDLSLFLLPGEKRNIAISGTSHLSPYFSGKTRFGGALSQNSRLSRTAPNLEYVPVRQKMKPKTTNISSTSTAKRILESLQKISAPLNVGQPNLKAKFVHPVKNISRTKFSTVDKKKGRMDKVHTKTADSVFTFSSPVEKDWTLNSDLPKPRLNFNFSSPINVHDSKMPVSLMESRFRPHD